MSELILATILYLPMFAGNAAPVIAAKLPYLRDWNGAISERNFGTHKTYRGFVSGIVCGTATAMFLWLVSDSFVDVFPLLGTTLMWGALLGMGALFGDLAKSYFKRRLGIAPGAAWPFFDGIDYIVGGILFSLPFFIPSVVMIVWLLILGPLASLAANSIAYVFGLKSQWY